MGTLGYCQSLLCFKTSAKVEPIGVLDAILTPITPTLIMVLLLFHTNFYTNLKSNLKDTGPSKKLLHYCCFGEGGKVHLDKIPKSTFFPQAQLPLVSRLISLVAAFETG